MAKVKVQYIPMGVMAPVDYKKLFGRVDPGRNASETGHASMVGDKPIKPRKETKA